MSKRCVCLCVVCMDVWVCECVGVWMSVVSGCVCVSVCMGVMCGHGVSVCVIFVGSRNINVDLENCSMGYKQIFKDVKKLFCDPNKLSGI